MLDELERRTGAVLFSGQAFAENTFLLGLAMQTAWLDLWMRTAQTAAAAMRIDLERRARTERLMRRGVPAVAAMRGLRVL